MLALLLGCPEVQEEAAPSPYIALEGEALARRVSLDVRGVVPSLAELDRLDAGDGIADLTSDWLADPRFEEHLVDALAEEWMLRLDELRVTETEFDIDATPFAYTRSFTDEPARLMAHVAASDLPWTDIVTADWTMANDTLAELVAVEFTDGAPTAAGEWKKARYVDGRPAGGVVMATGLWMRYHTTLFNYNRGRAAALSRYLLCYEFLSRPVLLTGAVGTSTDEVLEATQTVDSCIACHSGLDPLASSLFGFWAYEDKDAEELVTYHPERERYGEVLIDVSPAYFGAPLASAAQLGPLIAGDPRFDMCAVRRTSARLWGREPTDAELGDLTALRDEFRAGDLRMKALIEAVLATEQYRVGGLREEAGAEVVDATITRRVLSASTLASAVEDLTGFRWEWQDYDQLTSDVSGYRVLLGGADGQAVQQEHFDPSVSRHLVLRRVAQSAAQAVAAQDLAASQADRLLVGTTAASVPTGADSAALLDELGTLHRRVLSRRATEAELDELLASFLTIEAEEGAEAAYASVISVLLRDPEFWSY